MENVKQPATAAENAGALEGSLAHSASFLVLGVPHFLRLVRYRKNVVLMALVVSALLGGLHYATATRYYQSDASLLVLQTGGDILSLSMNGDRNSGKILPTHRELMKSAVLLQGAVKHLRPEHRIDFQGAPRDKWGQILGKNLSTAAVRDTNIIELAYRSKDPYAAAAVVHAVIQAYLEFVNQTQQGTASDIITVLTREKVQLEQKLGQKEQELLEARRNFGDLGIKPGGEIVHPMIHRAVRLNDALIEAQKVRLERQAAVAAMQSAVRNGANLQQFILDAETVMGREAVMAALGIDPQNAGQQAELERNLVTKRSELKALTEYYGPAHPRLTDLANEIQMTEQYRTDIRRRLADHESTRLEPMLIETLNQSLAKAWEKENSIRASFEEARVEAIELNRGMAQLELLVRDVNRLRNLHDVLVNQIANTDLRQEHGDVRATVVKEPAPIMKPISPRVRETSLMCLLGALMAGGLIIYVLDAMDDRFRSPEELRMHLGVPVLAMVRKLEPTEGAGIAGVQVNVAPDAVESEAFRTLRTALAFSSHETERMVISSSELGDGKTTVLANLAVSYAQSGKRTLLIDADLRRPGLTALLNMKGMTGVSDVLRAEGDVAELAARTVYHSDVERLDVLPAGPRRPNPAELLAGPNFSDLLAWADANYDQVLVDSPPVLAASDAQLVGRLVDGVILVVDANKNHRRMAIRAVESFTSLGVNVLGAVVNRISPDASNAYGYGYGYGYGYSYGESERETEDAPADAAPAPELSTAAHDMVPSRPSGHSSKRVVPRRVA